MSGTLVRFPMKFVKCEEKTRIKSGKMVEGKATFENESLGFFATFEFDSGQRISFFVGETQPELPLTIQIESKA